MHLRTKSGSDQENPTSAMIAEALDELERDAGFLVLGRADEDYVQAAGDEIEYRQCGRHWRHRTQGPDRDLARKILLSYFHNDDSWKTMVPWVDVTDELAVRPGRSRVRVLIVLVLAGAVIALALYLLR